jgi:hypothetical protein
VLVRSTGDDASDQPSWVGHRSLQQCLSKTCGIDWSEGQHDVAIVDDQARIIARARVTDDAAGLGGLLDLLAEHGHGELARIEIAIETDKGLFVAALVAAGWRNTRITPSKPITDA